MRHTKDQKFVGTNLSIIRLPKKTQRTIMVDFNEEEKRIYTDMEKSAKRVYFSYRQHVMKCTLRLLSQMMPLRDVCSGGALPEAPPDGEGEPLATTKKAKPPYKMPRSESTECPICFEGLQDPVATACTPVPHVFCRECIEGIIGSADDSKEGPCPMCRSQISTVDMRKVILPVDDDDDAVKAEVREEELVPFARTRVLLHDRPTDRPSTSHFVVSVAWLALLHLRTCSLFSPVPSTARQIPNCSIPLDPTKASSSTPNSESCWTS